MPLKGSGRKLDAVPAAGRRRAAAGARARHLLDTAGTFAKLWTLHTATRAPAVRRATATASTRSTIRRSASSPIANALTLVRALPAGARVHLVTHSRGGLVAEVLARACGGAPLGDDVLDALRRRRLRRAPQRPARARQGSAGARRSASSASSASPARRAARCWRRSGSTPTSRSSTGPGAGEHAGGARTASTSCTRSRAAAPTRRAARARGDDARQPGRRLAERRGRARSRASCASSPATSRATRSARG